MKDARSVPIKLPFLGDLADKVAILVETQETAEDLQLYGVRRRTVLTEGVERWWLGREPIFENARILRAASARQRQSGQGDPGGGYEAAPG
jgi:hypothetical protein